MRNLPHQAYDRRPLVWAAPPAVSKSAPGGDSVIAPPENARREDVSGLSRDIRVALSSQTFSFNYTNGAINTAFPSATRVAFFTFAVPVGVASVVLSTSIVNATTDGVMGVYVARNVGPVLDLSETSDIYVDHLVNQGLSHSMRSGMAFSDDVAPKFGSGEGLGIYISSAGTGFANNRAVSIATVRYFNLV